MFEVVSLSARMVATSFFTAMAATAYADDRFPIEDHAVQLAAADSGAFAVESTPRDRRLWVCGGRDDGESLQIGAGWRVAGSAVFESDYLPRRVNDSLASGQHCVVLSCNAESMEQFTPWTVAVDHNAIALIDARLGFEGRADRLILIDQIARDDETLIVRYMNDCVFGSGSSGGSVRGNRINTPFALPSTASGAAPRATGSGSSSGSGGSSSGSGGSISGGSGPQEIVTADYRPVVASPDVFDAAPQSLVDDVIDFVFGDGHSGGACPAN